MEYEIPLLAFKFVTDPNLESYHRTHPVVVRLQAICEKDDKRYPTSIEPHGKT